MPRSVSVRSPPEDPAPSGPRKRAAARVMPYNLSRRRAAAMSEPAVYSGSELNRDAKLLLREHFGAVLVEG